MKKIEGLRIERELEDGQIFHGEIIRLVGEDIREQIALREEGTQVGWVLMPHTCLSPGDQMEMEAWPSIPDVQARCFLNEDGRCWEGDDGFNFWVESITQTKGEDT